MESSGIQMKLCINCDNFIDGLCNSPQLKPSSVHGKLVRILATRSRDAERYCGEEGKWFVDKVVQHTKLTLRQKIINWFSKWWRSWQ